MGVAYYANYLTWFEVARTEYMRQAGISYKWCEGEGMYLPVTEAVCRYHHPARYDDELDLAASLNVLGAGFRFDYEICRAADGKRLATGWTEHVCVNAQGRIDRAATRRLKEAIEAGGPRA